MLALSPSLGHRRASSGLSSDPELYIQNLSLPLLISALPTPSQSGFPTLTEHTDRGVSRVRGQGKKESFFKKKKERNTRGKGSLKWEKSWHLEMKRKKERIGNYT